MSSRSRQKRASRGEAISVRAREAEEQFARQVRTWEQVLAERAELAARAQRRARRIAVAWVGIVLWALFFAALLGTR